MATKQETAKFLDTDVQSTVAAPDHPKTRFGNRPKPGSETLLLLQKHMAFLHELAFQRSFVNALVLGPPLVPPLMLVRKALPISTQL